MADFPSQREADAAAAAVNVPSLYITPAPLKLL